MATKLLMKIESTEIWPGFSALKNSKSNYSFVSGNKKCQKDFEWEN